MSWNQAYKAVEPYVVKIDTPAGSGTGFFFAYNTDKSLVSIATALHVVAETNDWRQPLKIRQVASKKQLLVEHGERAILPDYDRDTAVILLATNFVTASGIVLPENMLPLFPSDQFKRVGTNLGWVGYPAIAPYTLCLFQGAVSAFNSGNDSYYLDGVAINGVSGGPVFEYTSKDLKGAIAPPKIVGIVSAYHYNRQSGGNLPGLLMAHDATHLNKIVKDLKDVDEGQKKAAEEAQKVTSAASTPAGIAGEVPRHESAAAAPPGALEPEPPGLRGPEGPAEPVHPGAGAAAGQSGPAEPEGKRRRRSPKRLRQK
jgi:hypothetical protein